MASVRVLEGRRFDILAAVAGLLIAALLFPLRFLASQIYILTIPLVLGSACVLYLVAVYWNREDLAGPTLPSPVARLLPGVSVVVMAGMVTVAAYAEARTPLFHALAVLTGMLLIVQVVATEDRDLHIPLTLGQIILFAYILRLTALFATPGLMGIDAWTHVTELTRAIVDARALEAIGDNKHFASPLYHLLLATASMLYDLPLRMALYLSLGLVMPAVVLVPYSLASLLVTPRWAALAALLYSIGDHVIRWGLHIIPTSMGLAFYLVVLYALVRITRTSNPRDYVLLVFASVIVILTHQVASFIMLVTVAAAVLSQIVLYLGLLESPDSSRHRSAFSQNSVNLAGLFVFDTGFLTFMWSLTPYEGDTFLETILSFLIETIISSAGFLNLDSGGGSAPDSASAAPTLIEQIVTYTESLGFLTLLFATFVGCLYVVNRRRSEQATMTLLTATAVMLVFVLGLPIFGIENFIPTRWFAFLYAPMAVLGAIGLRYLVRNLDARVLVACLVLFTAMYPVGMLLSSSATMDNPPFEDQHAELAYTEAELAAVGAIRAMTGSPAGEEIRPDQVVFTDHPYQTVIDRRGGGAHPPDAIQLNGSGPAQHDITVYRRAQSTTATYFSVNGSARVLNVPRERICRPSQNVLYDNGAVVVCTTPG